MASPRFHSQRSELLLNVSAFYSSSPYTPRPRLDEAPVVAQSPITQFVQSESNVHESVDRVEDSYQESLPKELPPQPAVANDEEDLYGLSPKGRASLNATLALRRSAKTEQSIEMPKRNAIDAFLDAGATVPSSGRGPATASKEPTIALASDNVTRNANGRAADATLEAIFPEKRARDGNRKLQSSSVEAIRPQRAHGNDNSNKEGIVESRRESKWAEESAHAQRGVNKASISRDHAGKANEALDTGVSRQAVKIDRKRVSRDPTHDKKYEQAAKAKSGVTAKYTEPVHATSGKESTQSVTSITRSKDRPRRQAKQSALEKLRAKHGTGDSQAVDNITSDSADDASEFDLPAQSVKPAFRHGHQRNQLPTPVTNGNAPKEAAGPKPQGKLKTVKSKSSAAAKESKHMQNKPIARDDPVQSEPSANGHITATKKQEKIRSATPAVSTKSLTSHQKAQPQSEQKSSPKRHGALKRPARALPRGRLPQIEDRDAYAENTPGRKRKGRSASRTSRASTVKPGPTRQRMQSESVKERLDRANADLRESSVPQPSRPRNDNAPTQTRKAAVSTHNKKHSKPPSTRRSYSQTSDVPIASHQKPGSSQANAITIEQGSPSSSSSSPSPHRRRAIQSKATVQVSTQRNRTVRPKTPALVRSSPPGTERSTNAQVKDKPTIIAFGRQGPRNQGTSSAIREPRSTAFANVVSTHSLKKESNLPGRGRTNEFIGQYASRPSQPGLVPHQQLARVTKPSDVTASNEHTLGESTKNEKNRLNTKMLQSSHRNGIGSDDEDQHDGFAVIDDFDDTTLVNNSEQSLDKQPSTSQLAMPPPNTVSVERKSLKTVDTFTHMPKKKAEKTVPAKDTPRPSAGNKVSFPSAASNEQGLEPMRTPVIEVKVLDHPPPLFDANDEDHTLAAHPVDNQFAVPPSRRTRKRGQNVLETGSPSKKRKSSPQSYVQRVANGSGSTHEPRSPMSNLNVPQFGLLEKLKNKPEWTLEVDENSDVLMKDPVKRWHRRKNRTRRRTTQCSQGVDILGSPYPKELEVPTRTTALEVFSQQADLSSDQVHEFSAVLERSLELKDVPRMEPTMRSGILSSNGKPIPAAPQESSKAVTKVASGLLAEKLLKAKSADTSDDPFNTSSLVRKLNGPSASRYRAALRKHGIVFKDQASDERQSEEEDKVDDPDKTLVELFEEAHKRAPGLTISPVLSERSVVSATNATTTVLEDVGDWRNSLKPHQTHLFDSLVIAAHKLVRHMVDQETAERTVVADYRRRGEIIVSELHRRHAEEYQQYTQNMGSWKTWAADKLATQGRELKQSIRDVEKTRAERKKALLARAGVDLVLKELVAGLEA